MKDSKGNITAGLLVVGALVIGMLGGFAIGNRGGSDTEQVSREASQASTETEAASLRVLLSGLQKEHVSLAAAATRAGFDGDPQFKAAAGSLDENSKELAAAVGSVYGEEAEARFYEIWNSHIGFFVDYTVAAKGGDQPGMDEAVENLGGYVEAISTFLSEANPNLPKEAVAQLVGEHVGLLKEAVDNHGAGDFEASYAKEREARKQIGSIADAISGAIVKQNPDKF
ncbi:hypothetical protein BH23PAT1_BH23PAT1_2230 [soil metagenome]